MGVDLHQKLSTYVLNIVATFLGFTNDVEALELVLVDDLDRLRNQTETSHVRLGQYEDMG